MTPTTMRLSKSSHWSMGPGRHNGLGCSATGSPSTTSQHTQTHRLWGYAARTQRGRVVTWPSPEFKYRRQGNAWQGLPMFARYQQHNTSKGHGEVRLNTATHTHSQGCWRRHCCPEGIYTAWKPRPRDSGASGVSRPLYSTVFRFWLGARSSAAPSEGRLAPPQLCRRHSEPRHGPAGATIPAPAQRCAPQLAAGAHFKRCT